jgi:hypothetical protein
LNGSVDLQGHGMLTPAPLTEVDDK